jgi:hypothetical protein
MLAQFGIHLTKKDQIHRTGAEKSSKICAQLHRPNTRLCHKYDKIFKMENLEDHRKSARLSMLFKIQRDLIDIDRQQYLTPNDNRTRGKNRFYQERSNTHTYRQSFFPKIIRDWNQLPTNTTSAVRKIMSFWKLIEFFSSND